MFYYIFRGHFHVSPYVKLKLRSHDEEFGFVFVIGTEGNIKSISLEKYKIVLGILVLTGFLILLILALVVRHYEKRLIKDLLRVTNHVFFNFFSSISLSNTLKMSKSKNEIERHLSSSSSNVP